MKRVLSQETLASEFPRQARRSSTEPEASCRVPTTVMLKLNPPGIDEFGGGRIGGLIDAAAPARALAKW